MRYRFNVNNSQHNVIVEAENYEKALNRIKKIFKNHKIKYVKSI